MNDKTLINNLTETTEFKKLQELGSLIHDTQRQFDLLSVYKELIDEMAWSRLFAYLLDSTQNHGLGQSAFRKLLEIIPKLKVFSKSLPADKDTETLCVTEWKTENSRRIDILIKLTDEKGTIKAVVGIENKVDSGEQNDQIRDYQKSLIKAFPRIPKVLIYLTPDGRITETADDDLSCPALSVSFNSISVVCERIQKKTTGQGQIFLSVLKNHIDKLTNNQKMEKEALQLIKKLYQDPAHRQAIKLIGQYSPNTRSVFEDLTSNLKNSKALPFSMDEKSIYYHPSKSSNPQELAIRINELSDIVKGFEPYIMLRCENKNPDIGDIFTLRLALWDLNYESRDAVSKQAVRDKVQNAFSFTNSLGTNKHWWEWICVWTGNSYKLTDMGAKDVEGLTALLTNGIKQTYDQYKLGLKKLAKLRL